MTELLRLELPPDQASPRRARIEVEQALAGRYPDQVITDVLLVVSELVSNAAAHTDGGSTLVVRDVDAMLVIEAHDDNTRSLHRHATGDDVIGRGLGVVQSLTDRWGIERDGGGGKCVWAEFVLEEAAAPRADGGGTAAG